MTPPRSTVLAPPATPANDALETLLLGDGVTAMPQYDRQVWQGRPWKLAAWLRGARTLAWDAAPAAPTTL